MELIVRDRLKHYLVIFSLFMEFVNDTNLEKHQPYPLIYTTFCFPVQTKIALTNSAISRFVFITNVLAFN